jgi:uncharacterized protein (TIGR03790 family)
VVMIRFAAGYKASRALLLLLGISIYCSGCSGATKSMASSGHTPAEVLLVYNANSPISTAIAKDYSAKRGVTKTVVIRCADSAVSSDNETISLANYTSQIAAPVSSFLKRHAEINFIVLTKGVPIRIDGGVTGSRDIGSTGNYHPSVDSYLAAIGYAGIKDAVKISITGSGATGFGWLNRYWNKSVPFTHAAFGGYLVTRLDGYTQADAMALVARAITAEKSTQAGKVLLDVQPDFGIDDVPSQPLPVTGTIKDESAYSSWNADLVKAGGLLAALKIPADLDKNGAFVGDQTDLLGYFSWGSNDPKCVNERTDFSAYLGRAVADHRPDLAWHHRREGLYG